MPVPVKTINPTVSKQLVSIHFVRNKIQAKWREIILNCMTKKKKKKKKHLKILGSFFKVQTPYNLVSASSVLSSSSLLSCCCNILRSYGMAAFSCFFIFYIVVAILNCIYLHAALFEFEFELKKKIIIIVGMGILFMYIFL